MKKLTNKVYFLFTLGMFISLTAISQERPNIIWLMAEDIGPDIECYGMEAVKTPVLNKLAENGLKFNNCFVTNPICSPSRSAMMTGVMQNKINAQHHRSNRELPLAEPYKPFTYLLRKAGYTCILGNEYVMGKGRKIDVNFKHEAIGEWDGKNKFGLFDQYDIIPKDETPFFAQIQLKVTHRGDWWDEIREKSDHPVDPDKVKLPPYMADDPVVRLDWAKYLDQMEYMDHEIGIIIQDLKEKGLYENTVIIFIGDNGRCNIRGKGYLFDPGLHIPLIVSWPEGIKTGAVRDEIVSATDITATILDLAGIEVPEYMTGSSFMDDNFSREYSYGARDLWDEVMEKSRSLTSKKYKYIKNYMPEVSWDAHQAYLEFYRPAVHAMRKLKFEGKLNADEAYFFSPTKPVEELYDLENDPHELKNLAGDDNYKDILNQFRIKLKATEKDMTASSDAFHPVYPTAVDILDWVKYKHPEAYLEMLNGKEIGFHKYTTLYKEAMEKLKN
ncbi:sulfatase family protein [Flexithrix dorotheae]|uniref:sulfatase family protein n=1 Tax=Flexithrix dorotheae TaxID=70993 RepID=UPI000380EC66|nr:sulfatase [Flexithrix dorotheae]